MSLEEPESGLPLASDPHLVRVLTLLESMDERLSRLEGQLAQLGTPAAPSVAPVPAPIAAPSALQAALHEPRTVELLVRLLDRLELVDQSLVAVAQVPDLAAGAVDTVDRLLVATRASGIDVDARLQAALALVERLSAPETVEALLALTDNLDDVVALSARVQPMLRAAGQLPDVAAVATDTIGRVMDQLQEEGISLNHRLQGVVAVTAAATEPRTLEALERLLQDPSVLEQAADLVEGLSSPGSRVAHLAPLGPLAALRALYDTDVQRGLGVAIALARLVGQKLGR